MSKMRAVVVEEAGGEFELVERPVPEPGEGEVRIRVEACGICHSDSFVKMGTFPGIRYPRIPGHEVAGRIDAVGRGVTAWKEGQRVGVGWHGGHCFVCDSCRAGDFPSCRQMPITGITRDGGWADYLVARHESLAAIPETLAAAEAGPLLCAGITTYNSLRHSGARPGDLVAVHGLGGLGHLGVQFAKKAGYRTAAISHGKDKEELARRLGADLYLDMDGEDVPRRLRGLGGAKVILATGPNAREMSALIDGLAPNGTLLVVGAPKEPIEAGAGQLIGGRKSIRGWPSGSPKDSEETMAFCALSGVRPMVEVFPLEKAAEAYEHMMANRARFRAVLEPGKS